MTAPDPYLGLLLDEYRLEELLGQGGMASVYRALDIHLNRYVAVKIVASSYQQDQEYLLRFEREARAIAQLEHPHVIRLYRYGEADGLLYMAMQYIEGSDLGRIIESYRQTGDDMEAEDIVRITREVASALDYIHSRGIIHRDVKPSNIMLDMSGKAILTDFGLVLRMESGTRGEVFGSPHYLAPEQAISSAQALPQSDLYSLGVILFETFTGKLPFDAPDPLDIAMLHIQQAPPPPRSLRPDLSPGVESVIFKALAKKPEERYRTGKALADALERAVRLSDLPRETISLPYNKSKTIPERIALDSSRQPLPPLPRQVSPPPQARQGPPLEAVLQSACPDQAPNRDRPAAPENHKKDLSCIAVFLLLSIAAFLFFCIFSITTARQIGKLMERSKPTEIFPIGAEIILTEEEPTATSSPTNTQPVPTPSPSPSPSPVPSPTPTETLPVEYLLEIDRCQRGRCLVVTNIGESDFPLQSLQLKAKKATLEGPDWEVDSLGVNECIYISESDDDDDENRLPEGLSCEVVDEIRIRESNKPLLKDDLSVAFGSEQLWKCKASMQSCRYTIPVP